MSSDTVNKEKRLTYGKNNNYDYFADYIQIKGLADYGDLASALKHDDYSLVDIAAPRKLDCMYDGATAEEISDIFITKCIEHGKAVDKQKIEKKKFYGFIYGCCSKESKIAIEGHTNYTAADLAKCPLLLWRIISDTHRGGVTSQNKRMNRSKKKNDYNFIKMAANESLITHYKNFIYVSKNYHDEYKLKLADKEVQTECAWHFFDSLPNTGNLGQFKANHYNNIENGTAKEETTLAEMFQAANNYTPLGKTDGVKSETIASTIYAITNSREEESKNVEESEFIIVKKKHEKVKDETPKPEHQRPTRPRKPIESIQCHKCWKLGHFQSNCPDIPATGGAVAGKVKDADKGDADNK